MRAVLIGGESLLIQCGEFFRARHWRIQAVLSDAPAIQAWARNAGLAVYPVTALDAVTQAEAFDWLLAVTHLAVIPTPILARAARGAVNFHDGPLPRYGGLQAAAWALYNGETNHGITWHHMSAEVDGGGILLQRAFPIDETDSALTLNAKCWAAATDTLPDLAALLERGEAVGLEPVPPERKTYHGRADRPPELGRLRPEDGVRAWQRAARVADTGVYANPFVSPWIWLGDRPILVSDVVAESSAGGDHGLLADIANDALRVRLPDGTVTLSGFRQADGTPCDIVAACQAAGLGVGSMLPAFRLPEGAAALFARSAHSESHWVELWDQAHPVVLPGADGARPAAADMATSPAVTGHMPAPDDELTAALLLFLGRSAASRS